MRIVQGLEHSITTTMTTNHYLFNTQENKFRLSVKEFFNTHITPFIAQISEFPCEIDPRDVYRLMGAEKLLAPQWPEIYGGQNKTMVEMAIIAEEMVNANIPETLFVLSIQIVGNLIFLIGNSEQKSRWLPSLARGESFACVLFSEINAGSDLAAIETKAIRENDDYFEITGKKIYSLKTRFCQYGLCAARTNNGGSKYDGITVFFIPLDVEGILIREVPSMADEPFYEVTFDKVKVSKDNIIGRINEGWHVISEALMLERTGFDCFLKASIALNVISNCCDKQDQLNTFYAKKDAVRVFCYSLLKQYSEEQYVPEEKSAIAKWYASTLAVEILEFGVKYIEIDYLSAPDQERLKKISAIYRDTPGATLASGSSEIMLEIIARTRFDSPDFRLAENASDNNLLYEKFRSIFSGKIIKFLSYFSAKNTRENYSDELFSLIAPKENGGMDLGLKLAALMCEEAGKLGGSHSIIERLLGLNLLLLPESKADIEPDTMKNILSGRLAVFALPTKNLFRDNIGCFSEDYTSTDYCDVLLIAFHDEHYKIYLVNSKKFKSQKEILFGFDLYNYKLDPDFLPKQKPLFQIPKNDPILKYIPSSQSIYYSAYFLGIAQKSCALAINRVSTRIQFEKKIIDYQSPRFSLATILAEITLAQSYLDYAIWAVENKEDGFEDIAANAFELAKNTTFTALKISLHLHGAYGLTKEAEIQKLYRLFILQSSCRNKIPYNEEQ